jgi:hypothetical protein
LIRINLLTEAKAAAARKRAPMLPTGARLNNFLFFGGLALGVLYIAIFGLLALSERKRLDDDIAKARLEADRLKSIIEEVKEYEAKKSSLESKIQLINALKTNQKGPVRLMDEISKALPDLVWLTTLDVANNLITMTGQDAFAPTRGDLPREPEEEPLLRGTGLQVSRPGRRQTSGTYSWEMTLTFIPSAVLASAPAPRPGPSRHRPPPWKRREGGS